MPIRLAWIFRCDSPGCQNAFFSTRAGKVSAIHDAQKALWLVDKRGEEDEKILCPLHKTRKVAR